MSSLVSRIREDLERKIRTNEWRPGARIPTEQELMARYGCARMTVHGAISALVAQGLIERRKKAGSFVARPHVQTAVFEIPDIRALIEARGDAYTFKLLSRAIRSRALRDEERRAPDFSIKGRALVVEGIHIAAGRPFCFEHRVISLATAPEAEHVDYSEVAPGSWLLGHIPWSQARHRITACSAGEAAAVLKVGRTFACLSLERWTWLAGRPVTSVRQLFPGETFDLIAQFSPDGRG